MSYTALIFSPRKRNRFLRFFRALWRDTQALWGEFQRPILAFVLVTIVGGFVYGELHALAGYTPIPLIDRPYIMLQLMTLQASLDIPPEWYLIAFWYVLPLVLIFIVGNGVADFVRLFFNRQGRQNAWREALVSTYRNHVIVLGAGHVGLRVIRTLAEMEVDVVVIDSKPTKEANFVIKELGLPLIIEDGRDALVLDQAGLRHADAFVVCTGDDHINLEVVMKVRQINPKVRIVSRVWDDGLGAQMRQFIRVDAVISSSGLSAPVFAGLALGVEITQTINIDGEEYSTVKLIVETSSYLINKTIRDIQVNDKCDVVLHIQDNQNAIQPAHDRVVKEGDTLVIFAKHERTLAIATRNHYGK
jgi:voltage-gated potassium channel